MINKVVTVSVSLCLVFGCASVDEDVAGTGVTPTGVSAATGAIIGGGLGAIVGSTSGDAGAGLIIGSVAGAATGGIIGNSLEEQQQELAETEEILARQEETLTSQKVELDALRKELDEKLQSSNRPSGFQGSNYSLESYSGNPQAKPLVLKEQDLDVDPVQPEASLPAPRARLATPPTRLIDKQKEIEQQRKEEARARISEMRSSAVKSTPEPLPVQPVKLVKKEAPKPVKMAEPVKADPIKQEAPRVVKKEAPAPAKIAKAVTDPSCRRAEKEASKAEKSKSAADRLYYYRRALRFCPSQSDYHVEIGKVYMSVGRSKDAAYEFEQALRVDPDNTEGQRLLTAAKEG